MFESKDAETSLPQKLYVSNTNLVNKEVITGNEAVFSPDWQYHCFKEDDCKCSLCGIEMPPDFVEERREHSDFHLAERLQEKESSVNSRTSIQRQRYLSIIYMCVCVCVLFLITGLHNVRQPTSSKHHPNLWSWLDHQMINSFYAFERGSCYWTKWLGVKSGITCHVLYLKSHY